MGQNCPLSRGVFKSEGGGQLSIHYCTVFRTITSVNQVSLYGAVAEICEEYESSHDRTVKPVVGGQSSSSFVPSVTRQTCFWIVITVLTKIFYCNSMENELKSYLNKTD